MMQVQPNCYAFELARAKILMADDTGLNEPPCSVVPHSDYEPWSGRFNPVTQQPYVPDCVGDCDLCGLASIAAIAHMCGSRADHVAISIILLVIAVWISTRQLYLLPVMFAAEIVRFFLFRIVRGGVGCFCCFSYSPSHLCDECLHDHVSRLSPMYLD